MKKIETAYEYFIYYAFVPIIWIVGLFGNTMGFIVLHRIKMKIKNMYQYIFSIDTISLILLSNTYVIETFDLNLVAYSSLVCKVYTYLTYVLGSLSPMILVYILIERYLSIRYPVESNLLRENKLQIGYLVFMFILNSFYYILAPLYYDIRYESDLNATSTKAICNIDNKEQRSTLSYFLFINRILLPFGLMITVSILLVIKITKTNSNVTTFYSKREKLVFKKDVHLSAISIMICLVFICLNLPLIIVFFYIPSYSDTLFYLAWYIFLMCYTINFYLFLLTESSFRKRFFSMFQRSKPKYN